MDYLAEAKKFGGSPVASESSDIDYLSAAKKFGGTPVPAEAPAQTNKPINYLEAAKAFGGAPVEAPVQKPDTQPNPFIDQAEKQIPTPEEKKKEGGRWYDFLTEEATARHELAKKVGEDVFVATKNTPVQAKAAIAAALEGNDPEVVFGKKDWKDTAIQEARKAAREERGFKGAEDEYLLGITREKLRNLPQNLSFSLVSMGAGLAAGIPAALGTTPIGGYAVGAGASGLAAYRMDTNNFLRDLRENLDAASEKTTGKPLTDQQFIKVAKNYESMVREHGLWEALPEALSNVIGAKLGAALFKEAAPGIKGLLADTAKVGGQFVNELSTETITQTGQHNVEVDAGMSDKPKRSFTDIDDLKKSAQEVLPDVLLLTGVTTGGAKAAGAAYRGTQFAKNRELAQAIEEDVARRSFTREGIREEAARRMAGAPPTDIATAAEAIDRAAAQPPVAPPEPPEAQAKPAEVAPSSFSEENLVSMGIGKTNKKIRTQLLGKDLNNPDEREEVRSVLEQYSQNPKLSEGIRTKVTDFLNSPVMTGTVAATPQSVNQILEKPQMSATQVASLEGDFADVEEDVMKAYATGKGTPIQTPVGEFNVVALEDQNENGELFIHNDMGEMIGSVFFSKFEAPDGTLFEPEFNIDESYRSPEFDAEIYTLLDALGAAYPKAEEVITAEPTEAAKEEPPVPPGMTRLYHGSATPDRTEGPAWFSTSREYAKNYRDGAQLQYVDYPTEKVNAALDPDKIGRTVENGFTWNVELDSSETGPRQIVGSPVKAAIPKSITSMTRNEYQNDEASLGQVPTQLVPEGFSFANERGELLSIKELIDTYGNKVVNTLATLYGVRVKDLKRNAEKLLKIQQNLRAVEGLTEERLNAMTVRQLQELAKQIGVSKSGNKAGLVASIANYAPSVTKEFNRRVQNIKHKSAVVNALRNNQPVSDAVLNDYPDLAAYSQPRESKVYQNAIRQLALVDALSTIDDFNIAVRRIEQTLSDPEVDPLVAQVQGDVLAEMKRIREKTFPTTAPVQYENVDLDNSSSVGEQSKRSPSFKRKIKKINKLLQDGFMTEEQHTAAITQAIEDDVKQQKKTQKARGAMEIKQRLAEAAKNGILSTEDLELAEWFIRQNYNLFDDLGISIRQPTKYERGTSGSYEPFTRIATLLKRPDIRGTTIIHEFMHHMERMMPVEVQGEITKAWIKSFESARKKADKGTDQDLKNYFELLYNYHFREDLSSEKQMRAVMKMLKDGRVDYEFYQYVNPSEFWAVNAARIVENRFNFSEGTINKLKQWLRELAQKLKSVVGLPSDAPLMRALDSLAKADGKFKAGSAMLAQTDTYFALGPNQRQPTPEAKDALDEMQRLGMGERPQAPGMFATASSYVTDAVNNPSASIQSAKQTYTRWIDGLGTQVFAADRALNNNIQRAIRQAGLGKEEIIGYALNVSLSQTNHADAVATNHILYGDSRWNADLLKWEAINDDEAKLSTLARQTEEMAKAHGLSFEQAKLIAHRAFEARRLQGLQEFNEQIREEMRNQYDQGNVREANRLRRKLKWIHMNQEQIDLGLDFFDTFPELADIDATWNKMRENAARVMVDTGLWTEEESNDLLSVSDYVPFRRDMPEEAESNPKGFLRGLQVQAKERRLKGSELPVSNIYDNMAMWTQYGINRGVRNRSTVALVDALVDFGMAEKVSSPEKATNLVKAWRDGKLEYYNVSDPMFIPAFRGLESVAVPVFKTAAKFSNTLRDTVVMFPLFTVAQVPADAYSAMFSSGLKPQYALRIPFLAAKEFGKTLIGISKTQERLKKFGAVGVKEFMASAALKDAEIEAGLLKQAGVTKQILSYAKRGLKHFAMAGDNAVRQAVYEASMQAGLSEAEAIEKAFNVIHFRNMGTNPVLRMGGQIIPFFNAYLAAMDVTYKTITGIGISPQERREGLKTFIYMNAAVMTLSTLYAMANADDEDYLKKPTQVRDRLLMIPGSGGLSIPLRKDTFLLPKVLAEHLYLTISEKGFEDARKMRDSMVSWLTSSLFSPTLMPQILKPTVEVMLNKDFFMGRDLVPYYQSKMEKFRQFNDSTSELGKLAGKSNVISPIAVDHLMRGYLGSFGGLVLALTNRVLHNDPEVERPELSFREMLNSIPGTSSFISKPSENSLKTDFYILQEECNKAAMTLKDIASRNPKDIEEALKDKDFVMRAGMAKEINKIGRDLGKIRKYITYVSNAPESEFSAEKKAEEIRKMRELEWEVLKDMDVKRLRAMANL